MNIKNIANKALKIIVYVTFKFIFLFTGKTIPKKLKQTALLYKDDGFGSFFAKIRAWDAPYVKMEKLVPKKGIILDLGSGDGLFANYIALSSPFRKVIGIEMNTDRVAISNKGVRNTKFIKGDVTKVKLPKCDSVVMFHLLHHLSSYQAQKTLITKSMRLLKKNGELIIVEIDRKNSLKFLTTWLTDHFIVPMIFEKKLYSEVYFRNKTEWLQFLSSLGLKVRCIQADKGMPFSHIILVCQIKK